MKKSLHQSLIPLSLVTKSMFVLGLSGVLFLAGCEGEPADRNKDLLTIFAGELDNGTLVEACQELSDVCSVDNMGCAAFELFCGGDSEEVICENLGQTCEDEALGCNIHQQQCGEPSDPGRKQQCCALGQQCLAEINSGTGEIPCDPAVGSECGVPQGECGCEAASGETPCGGCSMETGAEVPEWLPESCAQLMQECGDLIPQGMQMNSDEDLEQALEQVCEAPEQVCPENQPPSEPPQEGQCCEMAQQCMESWEQGNQQDPGQGNIDQFCQQAMAVCQQEFADLNLQQMGPEVLQDLYFQVCHQGPPGCEQGGQNCGQEPPCEQNGQNCGQEPPCEQNGQNCGQEPPCEQGGQNCEQEPPCEQGGQNCGQEPPCEQGGQNCGQEPPQCEQGC